MCTPPASAPAHHVDLVIKTPSSESEAPLRLSVSLDGTVRDIKERLRQQHPEHPPPSDQRLIFAGKLLADSLRTADVLRQRDVNEPQTFHLMLPLKESPARSSSSSAPSVSRTVSAPAAPSSTPSSSSATAAAAAAATASAVAATSAQGNANAAAASAGAASPRQPVHRSPPPTGGAAAFWPPSGAADVPMPMPFTTAAEVPFMQQPHPFNTGGVATSFYFQEWDGQPYVFALPAVTSFAPPLPYVHAQIGTFALASLGDGAALGQPLFAGSYVGNLPVPTNLAEEQVNAENVGAGMAAAGGGEQAGGGFGGGMGLAAGVGGMGAEGEVQGEEGRTDSLKLFLKLAFFVYVLGQDGTNQRIILLLVGALVIFLAQTGRLDFLRGLAAPHPPPANNGRAAQPRQQADGAPPAAGDNNSAAVPEGGADGRVEREPADGAVDGDGNEAGAQVVPAPESTAVSLLRDIESVVAAFFTSLMPTWRPYDPADHEPPPQQPVAAGGAANM